LLKRPEFRFNDKKYRVVKANAEANYNPTQLEALKAILASRFVNGNMLNLTGIIDDPSLQAHNISANFNNQGFTAALFSIIEKNVPQVSLFQSYVFLPKPLTSSCISLSQTETVDFSNNRINTLRAMKSLHTALPNLKNLNFSNNNISSLDEFQNLRDCKNTAELLIMANTVCDNNSVSVITRELTRLFPKLSLLNNQSVRSFTVAATAEETPALKPTLGSFLDETVRPIVERFVTSFFGLYDDNRANLQGHYHANALFSQYILSKEQRMPDLYLNNNRNLWDLTGGALGAPRSFFFFFFFFLVFFNFKFLNL